MPLALYHWDVYTTLAIFLVQQSAVLYLTGLYSFLTFTHTQKTCDGEQTKEEGRRHSKTKWQ